MLYCQVHWIFHFSNFCIVFPIRYIPIPEYRYSGLQIPIPAKICRYLPALRTPKNGHFDPNLLPFEKKMGNIPLIYFVFTCKLAFKILAYLSKNTGYWSFGVHIFLNAQITSNLKLWMLQHFWVNNSLKIKVTS
jgi:hypothetical protein